jgi:hypothetical protein
LEGFIVEVESGNIEPSEFHLLERMLVVAADLAGRKERM